MTTNANRRHELRPHGIISPACRSSCRFFEVCGGFESARPLDTCFDATCCVFTGTAQATCNSVCPHRADFHEWIAELGGRNFRFIPTVTQWLPELPYYVPVIGHRFGRTKPLDWPVTAVSFQELFRISRREPRYVAQVDGPQRLREQFLLSPESQVILSGVAKDVHLERYWEFRRYVSAPEQLAAVGLTCAIAPNFSHFFGVPRTDNLYNRTRQMICLEELAITGLLGVPHLSAVMPADWQFWAEFLNRNQTVQVVAKEFQTGNRSRREGRLTIDSLARLQEAARRPLHLIAVGAAQFAEDFAIEFDRFTILDSRPFSMSWQRHEFDLDAGRQPWYPRLVLKGAPWDDLLLHNVKSYDKWINDRIRDARRQPMAVRGQKSGFNRSKASQSATAGGRSA